MAYCEWLSRRTGDTYTLPTEAWWERAARGGLAGKRYPWSDDPALAPGQAGPAPERPNDFGVVAVSYNLWEWTADWYAPDYYAVASAVNPKGPEVGVYRVLRGGGYRNDPNSATVFNRGSARPETRSELITFRVAKVTEPGAGPTPPPTTLTSNRPAPAAAQPAPAAQPAQPEPRRPAPQPAAQPAPKPAEPRPVAPAPRPAPPKAAEPRQPAPKPAVPKPAPAPAGGPVSISAVSFQQQGGELVIKLATNQAAQHKTMVLSGPDRLVVDVPQGKLTTPRPVGEVAVGVGAVQRVRYSQFQLEPPTVRAVIDLDQPLAHLVEATPSELRIRLRPR